MATHSFETASLHLSPEHACSYLPDHSARLVWVDHTQTALTTSLYAQLINQGFRRSGAQLYRPQCTNCQACIPLRVPVNKFIASRQQQRLLKKNSNWRLIDKPADFSDTHFALYSRYLKARHPNSSMRPEDQQAYTDMIQSFGSMTRLYEFWLEHQLIAVAITDQLPQGLSAVYTFFDPNYAAFSPGSFAILQQMYQAQRMGLQYLYLGYWVEGCRKMAYKIAYQPAEVWQHNRWQRYQTPGSAIKSGAIQVLTD